MPAAAGTEALRHPSDCARREPPRSPCGTTPSGVSLVASGGGWGNTEIQPWRGWHQRRRTCRIDEEAAVSTNWTARDGGRKVRLRSSQSRRRPLAEVDEATAFAVSGAASDADGQGRPGRRRAARVDATACGGRTAFAPLDAASQGSPLRVDDGIDASTDLPVRSAHDTGGQIHPRRGSASRLHATAGVSSLFPAHDACLGRRPAPRDC